MSLPTSPEHTDGTEDASGSEELETLLQHVKQERGFDFTGYKRASLSRRIRKRMMATDATSFAQYADILDTQPDEFTSLFNTVLINVTSFFRDPHVWTLLADDILPTLLADGPADRPLRVWSAGCASGQEVYSVVLLLAELLGADAMRERVKVYATDIDEQALQQARAATYSVREAASVPPELLEKYFVPVNGRFALHAELRRAVIFGRHDLIRDAPISRIDLLLCRNALMYLNADVQARILERLHFALRDTGTLVLGKAEMLWTHASLFLPFDLKRRLFRKVRRDLPVNGVSLLAPQETRLSMPPEQKPTPPDPTLREAMFDSASLAQIVVTANGTLTMANEAARAVFRLSARDINRPLRDMELSYRPADLRSLIDQATEEKRPQGLRGIQWTLPKGTSLLLDVMAMPLLDADGAFLGTSITFSDVTRFSELQGELREANRELETAYEELQSTNEELETTNEELQSTVEELETTNEELQSTNEELETMNEEMHSINEELQSTNEELRQSGSDVSRANVFLESVLSSIQAAVVVLDHDGRVQVWTSAAREFWGLRPEEVLGSVFLTLDMGLPAEALLAPIRDCLNGSVPDAQKLTVNAHNRRGKEFACHLTLTPLQGTDGETDGVILLMEDGKER